MKYIKVFETQADYEAAEGTLELPNVSLIVEEMTSNSGVEFISYPDPEPLVLLNSEKIKWEKEYDEVTYDNTCENSNISAEDAINLINALADSKTYEVTLTADYYGDDGDKVYDYKGFTPDYEISYSKDAPDSVTFRLPKDLAGMTICIVGTNDNNCPDGAGINVAKGGMIPTAKWVIYYTINENGSGGGSAPSE